MGNLASRLIGLASFSSVPWGAIFIFIHTLTYTSQVAVDLMVEACKELGADAMQWAEEAEAEGGNGPDGIVDDQVDPLDGGQQQVA